MESLATIRDLLDKLKERAHPSWSIGDDGGERLQLGEFLQQVETIASALQAMGIKKGDTVGILAESSVSWAIVDLAIMLAGGVVVPFFPNISQEHFTFEKGQTEPKFIFTDMNDQYIQLLEKGKEHPFGPVPLERDTLSTILYTSGSTGVPKGVMLTQGNLVGLIEDDPFLWDPEKDHYLSILPLAHTFSRTLNHIMIGQGISITYGEPRDISRIGAEIHPTIMIVVPRLLEKVYSKFSDRLSQSGWMGKLALSAAKSETLVGKLARPLFDKLVYQKLRDSLGGKFRVIISGGAHLNPHLYHFYLNIGFPVYEGWGLTEASTVTVNVPGKIKIGTVGPPLADLKVTLSDEGELLVKGSTVMQGYFQNEAATARALDKEGWLHTGDKATLDEEGYVTIEGRTKEMFKTSKGEFVSPVPIEQGLCLHPLIDMSLVVAEGRPFVTCLLFPDLDRYMGSSSQHKQIKKHIAKLNRTLDEWEQIVDYRIIPEPLTIASGDLTPTMKLRRTHLLNKYAPLINQMY